MDNKKSTSKTLGIIAVVLGILSLVSVPVTVFFAVMGHIGFLGVSFLGFLTSLILAIISVVYDRKNLLSMITLIFEGSLTAIGIILVIFFAVVYINGYSDRFSDPIGNRREGVSDWADIEVIDDDDVTLVRVEPDDGIPDDFEVYDDTTFEDVCDAITEGIDLRDPISGRAIPFDEDMFNRVATMYWFSSDEYDRMSGSRRQCLAQLSYIATLSYEFSNDNFDPEYVIYNEDDNTYEYHGVIDGHNVGNCVIVFSDRNGNSVYFEDAMCGDDIVWKFDFSDPSVFEIGLTERSLSSYPAGNFTEMANYFASLIDPVL